MKWLFLGICALITFALTHQINFTQPEVIQYAPATTLFTTEQELKTENRRLKEKIAQLSNELAQIKKEPNANSFLPTETSRAIISNANALEEQGNIESQLQEFNNMLAAGEDPITKIKSNFFNEAVDISWASKNQQQLEQFFTESLPDVHPQYIECRSTRCRITVPVSDQKNNSDLSQTLMQSIVNNNARIAKKIVIEQNTNNGTLNFYLARNGDVNLFQ